MHHNMVNVKLFNNILPASLISIVSLVRLDNIFDSIYPSNTYTAKSQKCVFFIIFLLPLDDTHSVCFTVYPLT